MENEIADLLKIIEQVKAHLFGLSEEQIRKKPAPGKWSKIEILGHLVDSGINNLQRFTEIQFSSQPYKYANYRQDDLVAANQYQEAKLSEVFSLYQAVNRRIMEVMKVQTDASLAVELFNESDGKTADLRFIMTDYVVHMEHHLNQLLR